MKAAVIGSPISHSLSPAIFAFISQNQGKALEYQAIEVKPEDHKNYISEIKSLNDFVGCNITLPLKEFFISSCDSLSEAAKIIGAMNVLQLKNGKLHGHNTDAIGIEKTFERLHFDLNGKKCLLWGAGGSAKAVAFVLGKHQAKTVYIYNRGERGQDLAQYFSSHYPATNFKLINNLDTIKSETLDLMINSTPLGMQGQDSGETYFNQCKTLNFSKKALAFDLIYVPPVTDFMRVSGEQGLGIVGGLGMLIDQALATWEIWFGPIHEEDKLHQRLKSYLLGILKLRYNPSPIYLAGFMGVGKSTVGRKLAELTKREFIDTDNIIEVHAKLSIGEIFSNQGEPVFRKLEGSAIAEASISTNAIISLGGGALIQELNRNTILKSGTLIYLDADIKTLGQRINDQGIIRPILQGLKGDEQLQKISSLLDERSANYSQAHFSVNTMGLNATQVCFDIISKIGERA